MIQREWTSEKRDNEYWSRDWLNKWFLEKASIHVRLTRIELLVRWIQIILKLVFRTIKPINAKMVFQTELQIQLDQQIQWLWQILVA